MKSIKYQRILIDWRNQAALQFQLLSDLCQLANKTIDDAIRRFMVQSFITPTILTESDFNTQLNATLNQFRQSTNLYFDFLVDSVRLLTQVDQPFMGTLKATDSDFEPNIIRNMVKNDTNGQQSLHVCF